MWTRLPLIMVSKVSGVWKKGRTVLAAPVSFCSLQDQVIKSALDNFLT